MELCDPALPFWAGLAIVILPRPGRCLHEDFIVIEWKMNFCDIGGEYGDWLASGGIPGGDAGYSRIRIWTVSGRERLHGWCFDGLRWAGSLFAFEKKLKKG